MRRWRILNRGAVSDLARDIEYCCSGCERDALLPIDGRAIAQLGSGGIIFDGPGELPKEIACPHCRRRFTTEGQSDVRQAV
jgi:DNA-directed RNA polymerase subunit RPC12/RpoP